MNKLIKNTPNKGRVRVLQFKEKDDWYTVCLEFNIVEYAKTKEKSFKELLEAMEGYVEAVKMSETQKEDGGFSPLNQKPIKEYENMWKLFVEKGYLGCKSKELKMLENISFAGYFNLGFVK